MSVPDQIPRLGRVSIDKSNSEVFIPPELELFDDMGPRAPMAPSFSALVVDMHVAENKKLHKTSNYKNSNLIVRRNTEFYIIIRFNRPFNTLKDTVEIEFSIGNSPDVNKGTYIIVSFGKVTSDVSWKCRVVNTQDNDVVVGITPDSKCIVGRFQTFVGVLSNFGKQRTQRNPDTDFYVLFNPWDPEDQVYMPRDSDRQEYVLNDVGVIFNGEFNNITSRSWNYGQFEQGILDACLTVMDAGKVPLIYRGNATEVVRQGSALINSNDDNGVLVGNWSNDYSTGTAPTAWTGSPEILLKYTRGNCVPVCFAQCWVYAGVMNTFLRCLGIPARVITNYCSAHDNGGDLKTDIVLDETGAVDRRNTRDSVWNYHCWNEVYMKRPDLPSQYSGWQVADSTPQETSSGLYRCGPTSVNAVKAGDLSYPFDARFVFAELNSDVIYHQCDKYGNMKTLNVDTAYVGKLIVTKSVNGFKYEDITSNYKYPEGSEKDKQTMQTAVSRGVPTRGYVPPAAANVSIELQVDTIKMGDDFQLTMKSKNQGGQRYTVSTTITGSVVFYTGVTGTKIKSENKTAVLEPWKTQTLMIYVRAAEYMPYLVEQSSLQFVVSGKVAETGASLSVMRVVTLRPPELTIRVSGSPRAGNVFTVILEFRNPYSFPLNNVQLRLDSPGLIKTKIKTYKQILPRGLVQDMESITPMYSGKKVLIACLDCDELRQVTNQKEIYVM